MDWNQTKLQSSISVTRNKKSYIQIKGWQLGETIAWCFECNKPKDRIILPTTTNKQLLLTKYCSLEMLQVAYYVQEEWQARHTHLLPVLMASCVFYSHSEVLTISGNTRTYLFTPEFTRLNGAVAK